MKRPLDDTFDPSLTACRPPIAGQVPQEHAGRPPVGQTPAKGGPDDDSSPRDWSQLGRRVLAEAWHRTTEELAARHARSATPVVPASLPEGRP